MLPGSHYAVACGLKHIERMFHGRWWIVAAVEAGAAARGRRVHQRDPPASVCVLLLTIAVAAVVAVFVTASSGQTNLAIIIGIFSAAFFSRVMC